jgi:hypothetical protein
MMMAAGMLLTAMASCNKEEDSWQETSPFDANGASRALFSVSDSRQVHFSRGNLQYQASTGGWRFAPKQYDCCGTDNESIGEDYDGWIDLLSWGTSGWSGGVRAYQPSLIITGFEADKYYIIGDDPGNGLVGQYANADWGVYNAISNGGNKAGMWRTLTSDEWVYVFEKRSGSRFCKAQIEGSNGMILLPDGWDNKVFTLKNINGKGGNWTDNTIDASTWTNTLEPAGVVFLPTTGKRTIANMNTYWDIHLDLDENYGLYWSTTPKVQTANSYVAYQYNFHKSNANLDIAVRNQGLGVRLVQDAH